MNVYEAKQMLKLGSDLGTELYTIIMPRGLKPNSHSLELLKTFPIVYSSLLYFFLFFMKTLKMFFL